ncbi:acyl-CoA N-acyltransferase [Kockovaella imperatae]|uniref:Acyl-CoA N-acyltransferase n=1 Tax=Kockovaella imperatae TaxID=4999 RepID=A0A1Y1UC04_9TREE|nr:acyl-CoA N-acyltransferase [Kockovaella imperatae]ORX35057.1 acyl-CoA N-acyltransferase [Kockovaella imperatae]
MERSSKGHPMPSWRAGESSSANYSSAWSSPNWSRDSVASSAMRQYDVAAQAPPVLPPRPGANAWSSGPPHDPSDTANQRHASSSTTGLGHHSNTLSRLPQISEDLGIERLHIDPEAERSLNGTSNAFPPLPSRTAPPSSNVKGKNRASFVDSRGQTLYWRAFSSEREDMEDIMRLTEQELSEPYNIYTFRYFLEEWPHLTIMVYPTGDATRAIATIIAKQEDHAGKLRTTNRGYIAMLSVDRAWRRRGIASSIVGLVVDEMIGRGADEIVLETEFDNVSSLALYESLGFMREKRLFRFYTNCKDAFRLILPINSAYSLEESPSEAELARCMIGTGPDDLINPRIDDEEEEALCRGRSDTPLPQETPQYYGLYT